MRPEEITALLIEAAARIVTSEAPPGVLLCFRPDPSTPADCIAVAELVMVRVNAPDKYVTALAAAFAAHSPRDLAVASMLALKQFLGSAPRVTTASTTVDSFLDSL